MKRLFKRYPFIVAAIVMNTVMFIINFIEKDGFNAAMNLEAILILLVFLHLSYRIDNLIDGYNNSMGEIYKWAKRATDTVNIHSELLTERRNEEDGEKCIRTTED